MTETIQGVDPRTGVLVGPAVAPTDGEQLEQVLSRAVDAAPVLAATAPAARAAALEAAAERIDASVDDLVELAGAETGLGPVRLIGEVARTTAQLRFMGRVAVDGGYLEATIDHADPASTPPRPDVRRVSVPVGPVIVFGASNFPFAFSVAGGDTASALAAGCPVVFKAHPGHPGTSERVAQLLVEGLADAGLPNGSFALVHGIDVGRQVLLDPRIKAGAFTGSFVGGRSLFDLAAGRPTPIPFYGELGSINPVVVSPAASAARPDDIAAGLVGSFTMGTGQFCTKPGIVFAPADGALVTRVAALVADVDAGPMLGDRLASGFRRGLDALDGAPGLRLVAIGRGDEGASGAWARARVFATDLTNFAAISEVLLTECFGPATVVVEYDDPATLLPVLGRLEGSLTATVQAELTDDPAWVSRLVELLAARCGRLVWNDWPTGVAVTWAMQHGGPYPATTSAGSTSVGAAAIARFVRAVAFQGLPNEQLPAPLQEANPLLVPRRVDGRLVVPG